MHCLQEDELSELRTKRREKKSNARQEGSFLIFTRGKKVPTMGKGEKNDGPKKKRISSTVAFAKKEEQAKNNRKKKRMIRGGRRIHMCLRGKKEKNQSDAAKGRGKKTDGPYGGEEKKKVISQNARGKERKDR